MLYGENGIVNLLTIRQSENLEKDSGSRRYGFLAS